MNCSGKTAIVAGGLGGIGYATCKSLLTKGVTHLAILDVSENTKLLKKISEDYPNAIVKFCKINVAERSEIDASFKYIVTNFESIDILVTSVGVVDEMNPKRCVEINLLGVLYLNYAAIDYMSTSKGGKGGVVANIASEVALTPLPSIVAYSTTKFGVLGLTQSLATDFYLERTGIRFMTICPGYTTTPLVKSVVLSPLYELDDDHNPIRLGRSQTPEACGELLVVALETNKNGSIWYIENGKTEEIIMPCLSDMIKK